MSIATSTPSGNGVITGGLLSKLAAAKRLPIDFLHGLGVREVKGGRLLEIPYRSIDGAELAMRLRTAVIAKEGSKWPTGTKLRPYGEWRLDHARKLAYLILVEGETDCWALWHHDFPALGIPGANAAHILEAQHLECIERLYIHREPDKGGETFVIDAVKRLRELGFKGDVFILTMPKGKDPADLHVDDPARFNERLASARETATPVPISQPAAAAGKARPVDPRANAVTVRLDTVKPDSVAWLWRGRIPLGKLTVLDGDPDLGKSTLTMDLAARVTIGAAMPDETPGIQSNVLILSAEDGLADTIAPRLHAAGANCRLVHALTEVEADGGKRPLALPDDLPLIEERVQEHRAKLVVLDPLMAYLAGTVNTHKDHDVRRVLHAMKGLAERTGAAWLIVRHLNKAGGGNPIYRGGGSIGIIGAARSGLIVAKDPDNEELRILASTKSNLAELPASLSYRLHSADNGAVRVEWLGTSQHTAESILAVPVNGEERDGIEAAADVLRTILADGPLEQREVMAQTRKAGLSQRTVERAKGRAGIKAKRVGFGASGKWFWSIGPIDRQPHRPPLAAFVKTPEKTAVSSIDRQSPDTGGLCEREPGEEE